MEASWPIWAVDAPAAAPELPLMCSRQPSWRGRHGAMPAPAANGGRGKRALHCIGHTVVQVVTRQ
jgi:hypothetical protein